MQIIARKTKVAATRKHKAPAAQKTAPPSAAFTSKPSRKAARISTKTGTSAATRKLICAAVKDYVSTNYDALIADLIAQDEELAALFVEIDRNLDASEQRTARLLAA